MSNMTPVSPWALDANAVLDGLGTSERGLSPQEADRRRAAHGRNEIQHEAHATAPLILIRQFTSPLTLILIGASLISFSLGDRTETIIILVMVVFGGLLAFTQEYRSERALRALRKQLTRFANVIRDGVESRIDANELVVGDIVELELGSVVPADLRMMGVEDLQIDESALTGESFPVPKMAEKVAGKNLLPQEQSNIALLGTSVVQGSGTGVVINIGAQTEFGRTAALLAIKPEETDFQQGIRQFGNFLLKITLGLAFIVFAVLLLVRGNWNESLLFALALAVGISPELLPVIVTINLSRGALAMSKKKVLVKRLIAIEDLGNADVFCTDKTGTLTVGTLRVRGAFDPDGKDTSIPQAFAGLCLDLGRDGRANNPIDEAILESMSDAPQVAEFRGATRRELISFDFTRRRMSCVVERTDGVRSLVTKGALTEVLQASTTRSSANGTAVPLTDADRAKITERADKTQDEGYRLVAVARRDIAMQETYGPEDEKDLELLGFILVSDAPKQTAKASLIALEELHVRIVILTGDNERVTMHVASQLGFKVTGVVTGDKLQAMGEAELEDVVATANVFARITPEHKLRIIQALKKSGHTVGYMGDGVNDAPALRAADVGISFEDAVDVAKEAAGVILLEKKLSVLADGIREGRRTFVNIRTYIYATISSNFGNMLSVAGAALLLPFIPLLPSQILLLNLISDLPMLSLPGDNVDEEELRRPHKWNIQNISNFMYFFGTISSVADYTTFALLMFVVQANVALFRSGWFLESMLTELVVIFLLRSRKLSLKNLPSKLLTFSSIGVFLLTFFLIQSPLGQRFDLVPLPGGIIVAVLLIVLGYAVVTELGKIAYYRFRETTQPK